MKRFFSIAGLSMALSLVCSPLLAYEQHFPPYPAGKFPSNCSIHELQPHKESDRNKDNYSGHFQLEDQSGGKSQRLELTLAMDYSKERFGLYASLADLAVKGKVLVPTRKISDYPTTIDKVYWGYLNKDDVKDIIVNINYGEMNLSGGRQHSYLFLSRPGGGYSLKKIGSYQLEPADFYDYSSDNKCEYLNLSFVPAGKKNYWVYNVLQFIGTDVVIKNQLSRYFPKWIEFGLNPNDKAAKLSDATRKKLWQDHLKRNGKFTETLY